VRLIWTGLRAIPRLQKNNPLQSYIQRSQKSEDAQSAGKQKRVKPVSQTSSSTHIKPIPEATPFTLPDGDKALQWNWLRKHVLDDPVCNEHVRTKQGKKVVFGVGNIDAELFFCGEAPGEDEEIKGEPFVGRAGQLLDKVIKAMGLGRNDVYIGNIMNWRPEHDKPWGNRPPTETELNYCLPHLIAQVQLVKPKVIIALGATAANGLLGYDSKRTVARVRGKWLDFQGVPLVITYHPSYLLRNGTQQAKRLVWEDMLQVMQHIGMSISEKQQKYFL